MMSFHKTKWCQLATNITRKDFDQITLDRNLQSTYNSFSLQFQLQTKLIFTHTVQIGW